MSNMGLDTTELIFSIAIALLYPCFFVKLTNKVTGYDEINSTCQYKWSTNLMINKDTEEHKDYETCRDNKEKKLEKAEFNKHVMLIVIALIGVILTSVIQTKSTKFGIGLGGVFTLIFALSVYWHRYNENAKLAILGMSLLSIVFLSIRLYKIDNIADLFSLEFGTK